MLRWGAGQAATATLLPELREARLAVEHVQLVDRQLERHDVAGADAVRGVDDRDDLGALDRHVEQLLVAEVLDDVGRALDGRHQPRHLAELEVLRTEAHDRLGAHVRQGLAVLVGQREVEPALVQLGLPGAHRDLDEVHRRAADEAGHEPVLGVVVQVLRGADLLEQALAHDRDPLAHRHRLDLVVGDVDHRGPEPLVEPRDLGAGLHAQLGIEVGQRLVHEEHRRLADDRPAERDALPLAAGQLLGLAVEEPLELQDARRLADPLLDLGLGHLAELEAEGEVVADRHVRVERVALEHHGDVAVLRRDVVDHLVADAQLALGDLLEPRDHPQAGGLPAPRRPDEHHELAVADLEVEVRYGGHVAVALVHVIERHGRHAGTSVPSRASRAHASGRRTALADSDEPRTRSWFG